MVALPKDQRCLKHISKPLKKQMKSLIDRTRWPVLITYSDESVGHTGYVYECSGWPTMRRHNPTFTTPDGCRVSSYSAGKHRRPEGERGDAWLQRWEHWIAGSPADPQAAIEHFDAHWKRVPVEGKTWRSGAQAYTYERQTA